MVLIDAMYINDGGGKILLDYLVSTLEQTDLKIYYLFDSRVSDNNYQIKISNQSIFLKASLKNRLEFYKKNKDKFSKVFILGNVPPQMKLNCDVFTYFHNPMYLKVPSEFSIIEKIKYILKVFVIKKSSKNTDYWLVQSELLKSQFISKFKQKEKVNILSFYPHISDIVCADIIREKNVFFYVSNAQANKNHKRLIEAFCKFYDEYKIGRLIVTVSQSFPDILAIIATVRNQGYPIENIGFVNRSTLKNYYLKSEYVIFPSLAESFGLGLIEGVEMGCKIIASDLEYTYAVCEPSCVFNPFDKQSIADSLKKAVTTDLPASKSKVYNQIDELIANLS